MLGRSSSKSQRRPTPKGAAVTLSSSIAPSSIRREARPSAPGENRSPCTRSVSSSTLRGSVGDVPQVVVAVPLGLVDPERRDHGQVGKQAYRADRREILGAVDEPSRRILLPQLLDPAGVAHALEHALAALERPAVVTGVEGTRDRVEGIVRLVDDEGRMSGPRGDLRRCVRGERQPSRKGLLDIVDASSELGRPVARNQVVPERVQRREVGELLVRVEGDPVVAPGRPLEDFLHVPEPVQVEVTVAADLHLETPQPEAADPALEACR